MVHAGGRILGKSCGETRYCVSCQGLFEFIALVPKQAWWYREGRVMFAPPPVQAPESALRSHSCVALSSAQAVVNYSASA
jgi:hypothetical protein